MKKIFSLFLIFVLLFSLSAVSFADGEEAEYNWGDVVPIISNVFSGDGALWRIKDVEAVMWLPGVFIPADLSEDDAQSECIGFFTTESGSASILLYYVDMDGISLNDLYSYYKQNDIVAEMVSVNGIPAILQKNTDSDMLILTFQTRDGKLFQVLFSPISDENYAKFFDMVISSIQPDVIEEPVETVVPQNPVSGLISK